VSLCVFRCCLITLVPFYNSKNATNSNEIHNNFENYLSNQTNINQYDLINGLEPDEIDIVYNSSLEDGIIEDILVGNGSLENLIIE
jgi:hypothetical protein